jgi:hypothetical protein
MQPWMGVLVILCVFAGEVRAATEPLPPIADESEVEVEPKDVQRNKICNCTYSSSTPYSQRRTRWGGYFGVQSGLYEPVNYDPDFQPTQTFDSLYGGNKTPVVEIVFGLKLNYVLGSLALQGSAGYFSRTKEINATTSSVLTAQPITGALVIAFDNLFKEPYVVPYGMGGISTVVYSEKAGGLSVSGNSPMAPFYAGGLMIQLNWIDPESAASGYEDSGLENTFLYVEARTFLQSLNGRGPDFSTPVQLGGGLKVEF